MRMIPVPYGVWRSVDDIVELEKVGAQTRITMRNGTSEWMWLVDVRVEDLIAFIHRGEESGAVKNWFCQEGYVAVSE